MALTTRLKNLPDQAMQQARRLGLEPLLVKHVSRFVIPFVRRSGAKVEVLEPGRVVCRMPLRGNVNHIGTMYAGALFTLAEFAGGPLLLGTFGLTRYIPIITALDMAFVKATKTDAWVELSLPAQEIERLETEVAEQGEAAFVLEGKIKDADGNVVATSHARYLMRPRRR